MSYVSCECCVFVSEVYLAAATVRLQPQHVYQPLPSSTPPLLKPRPQLSKGAVTTARVPCIYPLRFGKACELQLNPRPLQHCMPMTAAECAVCGREELMLCSRCQMQHYCCRKCQKRHWKHHRSVCFPNIWQSSAEPKVTARLMNGTSRAFRLDSTSPVSLLYCLVET